MNIFIFITSLLTAGGFVVACNRVVPEANAPLIAIIAGGMIFVVILGVGLVFGHRVEDILLLNPELSSTYAIHYGLSAGFVISAIMIFLLRMMVSPTGRRIRERKARQ